MSQKVIITILIILVLLGLGVYGYFKAVPGANNQAGDLPKIEITPESYDFGQVKYGITAKYTFKVKNTGSAILEITKTATSCGCTTAEIVKKAISPGEEVDLQVEYDTGAMSGAHAKGNQERIIYVRSNDPINPQIEAVITADVR